jgi:hypothetical protein
LDGYDYRPTPGQCSGGGKAWRPLADPQECFLRAGAHARPREASRLPDFAGRRYFAVVKELVTPVAVPAELLATRRK